MVQGVMKRLFFFLTVLSSASVLTFAVGCGGSDAPTPQETPEQAAAETAPIPEAAAATPSTPSVPSNAPEVPAVTEALLAGGLYTTSHVNGAAEKCDYQITPTYTNNVLASLKMVPTNFGCAGDFAATCAATAQSGKVECKWTTPAGEVRNIVDVSPTAFTHVYPDGTRFTFVNTNAPTAGNVLSAGAYKGAVKGQPAQTTCELTLVNHYSATGGLTHVIATRSNCRDTGKEIYACDPVAKTCNSLAGTQQRSLKVVDNRSFEKTTAVNGATGSFSYTQIAPTTPQ